jgi:membrane fusion protein (multidrug efflux system)
VNRRETKPDGFGGGISVKQKWVIRTFVLLGICSAILLTVQTFEATAQVQQQTQNQEEEKKEEKVIVYDVELFKTEPQQMETYVQSTSTLKADRQVDIFSKVAGQIAELRFEEGQQVKKGDVLVVLDGYDERLKLEQAKVNLSKAKAAFARAKKSFESKLVSEEEYEVRKFEKEQAQAEYNIAEYNLSQIEVKAPFAGTVITRDVETGQTIQPSEKICGIATLSPLEAEVFLTEEQVRELVPGQMASLSRKEDFESGFSGKLARIAPTVDQETGTVKVTLEIDQAPENVRPGSYVHLQIITDSRMADQVIPKKALVYDSRQNTFVFKVEPNPEADSDESFANTWFVTRVPVQTGIVDGTMVEITSGLQAGDMIVVTGKDTLKDGSVVRDASAESKTLAMR